MKEKLIKIFERKERYMKSTTDRNDRKTYFSQAFGALEMAMDITDNWDAESELVDLWNDEWKERLEGLVYEVR